MFKLKEEHQGQPHNSPEEDEIRYQIQRRPWKSKERYLIKLFLTALFKIKTRFSNKPDTHGIKLFTNLHCEIQVFTTWMTSNFKPEIIFMCTGTITTCSIFIEMPKITLQRSQLLIRFPSLFPVDLYRSYSQSVCVWGYHNLWDHITG